jgi:7-cyano-7-deazaguanine synthase
MGQLPAVVLFSGGLDSTTVLAYVRKHGFQPIALTFRYGQRHHMEVDAARRIASDLRVAHHIIDIDLAQLGGSALTDKDFAVPHWSAEATGIPITYVPARNTIFLAHALAFAEVTGANDIFIGVNAIDYSGYPDCRPEYIAAFETMANLATKASVENGRHIRIHAPLITLSKTQIITMGTDLGVNYARTHSCYDPRDGRPCRTCDSCVLRQRGFTALGRTDPARGRYR